MTNNQWISLLVGLVLSTGTVVGVFYQQTGTITDSVHALDLKVTEGLALSATRAEVDELRKKVSGLDIRITTLEAKASP